MNYFRMAILGFAALGYMDVRAQGTISPESVDEMVFVDIKSNNTARAEELIHKGINVNSRDGNGATLIMWAALKTDFGFVKKLAALGADPRLKGVIYLNEERTAYYGSLMSIAIGENKPELVKFLVEELKVPLEEKEYEPKMAREVGWTAIEWASHTNNKPILDYLISKGAVISEGIITGGLRLLIRQEYNGAIQWTNQMLQLFGNRSLSDSIQATAHYIIGESYNELGDYDKAGVELQKAADFAESCKVTHPYYVMIYISLAASFKAVNDYDKALEIYLNLNNHKEVLEDKKQKGIFDSGSCSAELFKLMANTYRHQKMYDQSGDFYQKALNRSRQTKASDNIGTANILTDFGFLKMDQREYAKAKEYFDLALTEVKDFEPQQAQKGLVRVYSKMKQYDKAEQALDKLLTLTIAKYGEGSRPHLSVLMDDYALLYYESRTFEKQVPHAAAFFRYQLKNLNSMKEPVEESVKPAIKNDYVNNFSLSYFLASQSWASDTSLTSTLYNYQLKVVEILDKDLGKHHGNSHGLTWQKKRNTLSKNEVNIEIIQSPNDTPYPPYYALVVSKQTSSPVVIPLYDSTAATADIFKLYGRLAEGTKQNVPLQESWQSVVKKFENVKKIKITFQGTTKPNIRNLYSLVTRKYFLDGISSKIIQED